MEGEGIPQQFAWQISGHCAAKRNAITRKEATSYGPADDKGLAIRFLFCEERTSKRNNVLAIEKHKTWLVWLLNKAPDFVAGERVGYDTFTYHLGHTKTMPEIVKRHLIVVLVHLVQPLPQRVQGYIEFLNKSQLNEHGLHQMNDIGIAPLVRIEGRQTQSIAHLFREGGVAYFQEAFFNLLVFGQATFAALGTHGTLGKTCKKKHKREDKIIFPLFSFKDKKISFSQKRREWEARKIVTNF